MHPMSPSVTCAPGWPGLDPRWTSSAKTGLGTALSPDSRVWFTLSHGILDEIYFPRVDQACTRDLGLIVTDGRDFFSEEKRHARHETTRLFDGVPAYRLVNTCDQNRYRIEKEIVTDSQRPTLLQRTRFAAMGGAAGDYSVFVLLAPHLANRGGNNTAWLGDLDGRPMLFAERDGCALALACSTGWLARSAGFVGTSDGWQDLRAHRKLTWSYDRAENGNVALTGGIRLAPGGEFVLALGFGATAPDAARCAAASLEDGFERARDGYVPGWKEWQASLTPIARGAGQPGTLDAISAAVIRTCESKAHQGGIVASLSLPWGFARGDDDLGGYHLVWPRDLAETGGALVAIGATEDVRRVLSYLHETQLEDGHWSQNMWIDGTPYWGGVQLDETALPILLVDLARRENVLLPGDVEQLWLMVRRAAVYLLTNGPVALQDRWEEDPGYSPFTLAAAIAALLAAADLADLHHEDVFAAYARDTADTWNAAIERWTYVADTDLARQCGVTGYYVRIAPPEVADAASPIDGFVPIKNRQPGQSRGPAAHIISPDALALVRFGLRAPDDPRILNTVTVIDALLKVELPAGPAWHRYTGDGYGEHADGSAFDGVGIGRPWPLLVGERAHYELAAGRPDEAARLLRTMEAFANEGGLIPEQIWDAPDVSGRELSLGGPTGSAIPLVWAHAEYLKLRRSLAVGHVFDLPPQPRTRYVQDRHSSRYAIWRFSHKSEVLCPGQILRLETMAPAVVHWSSDGWRTVHDANTRDTEAGLHVADLPTAAFGAGVRVLFTFFWPQADRWEGQDFAVAVNAR
jgi:glucoamylase